MSIQIGVQFSDTMNRADLPGARQFKEWATSVFLKEEYDTETEMAIRVVDQEESLFLNRTWRRQDKPTNVLAFPTGETNEHMMILGDIALCAPIIQQEAKVQKKTLEAHWAHMVIHGTLHLLGYDHDNEYDAKRMESIEVAILASLSFPNPYD